MKLKTWQKWGLMFGTMHIVICFLFFYLNKYSTGCPSIMTILCMIDAPIFYVGLSIFGKQFYNVPYFLFNILLIVGTLFFFLLGIIGGNVVKIIRGQNSMFIRVIVILISIISLLLMLDRHLREWSIFLFILFLIALSIAIFSFFNVKKS